MTVQLDVPAPLGNDAGDTAVDAAPRREVHPYDFARPVTLSREHARTLESALEAFARQAGTVLSSSLRTVCHLRLLTLEQTSYVDYVESLEEQTLLQLLSLEPLTAPGMWEVPVQAAMTWVDLLLGGRGGAVQPLRPLSDLETAVLSSLVQGVLTELSTALDPVVPTAPEVIDTSYKPRLAHLMPNQTVIVVAAFALKQGESEFVTTLCLPFSPLLPHLEKDSPTGAQTERDRAVRAEAATRLHASLQDVPVDVAIACRPTDISPARLAGLSVGDVVPLRHPSDAPLDIVSGDVVFARGTPGSRGESLACLVVAPISEDPA